MATFYGSLFHEKSLPKVSASIKNLDNPINCENVRPSNLLHVGPANIRAHIQSHTLIPGRNCRKNFNLKKKKLQNIGKFLTMSSKFLDCWARWFHLESRNDSGWLPDNRADYNRSSTVNADPRAHYFWELLFQKLARKSEKKTSMSVSALFKHINPLNGLLCILLNIARIRMNISTHQNGE